MSSDAAAPEILDKLIHEAEQAAASDVHLQMTEHGAEVAFRLDGLLTPVRPLPAGAHRGRFYVVWTKGPSQQGGSDTNIELAWADNDAYSKTSYGFILPSSNLNTDTSQRTHMFPSLGVDTATGNVAVGWYDCRNHPRNTFTQCYTTRIAAATIRTAMARWLYMLVTSDIECAALGRMRAAKRQCCKSCGAARAIIGVITDCLMLGLMHCTLASEVTVDLGHGTPDQPVITVNAGDTVTWRPPSPGYTARVQGYGGGFDSGPLTNGSPTFSVQFTNPAFYAYWTSRTAGGYVNWGTVEVLAPTGPAAAVTVNSPRDGFAFPAFGTFGPSIPIQVSTTNPTERVRQVDILTNGVVLAMLTQPPYRVIWSAPPLYSPATIIGRVTLADGKVVASPPITVTIGSPGTLLGPPHRLPGGAFVFYYCAYMRPAATYILYRDRADPPSSAPYWSIALTAQDVYGVFVDESAVGARYRFYTIGGDKY